MYIRDDSSGRFAYLQLYTMLKKDIVSGLYPFGSRLPSKRSIEQEGYFSMITSNSEALRRVEYMPFSFINKTRLMIV